nr:hypothetical protein [Tanacetum cinerariifolium]GFA10216.1 hypothetical protein [Tanacetum cinerariifolium]
MTSKNLTPDGRQLDKRDNPNKVYSDWRIVDVIRVQYDQVHGQEFMKEIVVKRANGLVKTSQEVLQSPRQST